MAARTPVKRSFMDTPLLLSHLEAVSGFLTCERRMQGPPPEFSEPRLGFEGSATRNIRKKEDFYRIRALCLPCAGCTPPAVRKNTSGVVSANDAYIFYRGARSRKTRVFIRAVHYWRCRRAMTAMPQACSQMPCCLRNGRTRRRAALAAGVRVENGERAGGQPYGPALQGCRVT